MISSSHYPLSFIRFQLCISRSTSGVRILGGHHGGESEEQQSAGCGQFAWCLARPHPSVSWWVFIFTVKSTSLSESPLWVLFLWALAYWLINPRAFILCAHVEFSIFYWLYRRFEFANQHTLWDWSMHETQRSWFLLVSLFFCYLFCRMSIDFLATLYMTVSFDRVQSLVGGSIDSFNYCYYCLIGHWSLSFLNYCVATPFRHYHWVWRTAPVWKDYIWVRNFFVALLFWSL